jgi:hypothetical protein
MPVILLWKSELALTINNLHAENGFSFAARSALACPSLHPAPSAFYFLHPS